MLCYVLVVVLLVVVLIVVVLLVVVLLDVVLLVVVLRTCCCVTGCCVNCCCPIDCCPIDCCVTGCCVPGFQRFTKREMVFTQFAVCATLGDYERKKKQILTSPVITSLLDSDGRVSTALEPVPTYVHTYISSCAYVRTYTEIGRSGVVVR